ncbi:hypothetical protein OS188_12740 [Xanthomarina sp. F1114]|uniref:hypothetical protein n=1 Tax=Xanthomarina sp. F1114 TaxID=2996019 RepID=UPI00225E0032|nr:hypothetical protein [Xanthomarina sp. F1114]MCX7548821.1 hypothetical protein [Xanthomarina sp. F1114]
MKIQKQFLGFIFIFIILISFSQCSSAQKLQDQASFELGEISYQKWFSGVQGGGSGYTLSLNLISNKNNVVLDSVYFRDYRAKIEAGKSLYIANIITESNQSETITMSNSKEEFGNKLPKELSQNPFNLVQDECVISYIENNTTKYLKVNNLMEKQRAEYPLAPPKKP